MGKESRIKTCLSVERGHREQGDFLVLAASTDFLTQGVPRVFPGGVFSHLAMKGTGPLSFCGPVTQQ